MEEIIKTTNPYVVAIGGIFIKSNNADTVREWYKNALGINYVTIRITM